MAGEEITQIELYVSALPHATSVAEIMGYEGNIRQTHYRCFEQLVNVPGFTFGIRSTLPPQNELNALRGFGPCSQSQTPCRRRMS